MNTRLLYDEDVSDEQKYMSMAPGQYVTTKKKPGLQCFPIGTGPPANFFDFDKDLVDVENKLSNRNKQSSKYSSNINDTKSMLDTVVNIDIPSNSTQSCQALLSSNTLLMNPKSDYRNLSTGSYNFNYLPKDPQENYPDYRSSFGENTRQFVIDTYNNSKQKKVAH